MSKVKKQSEFMQNLYNEAKMGAYYTDPDHCKWISNFLEFSSDETCCLDPAIGNGNAIKTIVKKMEENKKIFGVELNQETYQSLLSDLEINQCIHADFLTDIIISHNSFSFVFSNPPYGTVEIDNEMQRLEIAFFNKLIPYLTKDAVLVYVVPQYVCADSKFLKGWCKHFETKFIYRFHDKEYEKYKQVVLFGQRKKEKQTDTEEEKRIYAMVKERENIPLLPQQYDGEKLKVAKSVDSNINQFMPETFHVEEAAEFILKSPLYSVMKEKIEVPRYTIDNLGRPPIMPQEGQMYLLAVSGAGQGLVGSEEKKDLHLQRGTMKIEKKSEIVTGDDGVMKEVEITFPQVCFNLIENNGDIRTLQ